MNKFGYLYDLMKEEQRMYLKINEILSIDNSESRKRVLREITVNFYETLSFMIIKNKIKEKDALSIFDGNMIKIFKEYKEDITTQSCFKRIMKEMGY